MNGNACSEPKPSQSETLAQLCAELDAENWFEEPPCLRTSRGEFRVRLDIDQNCWSAHQISRLQFTVSGEVSLGSWCLDVTFVSPGDVGSPSWWYKFGSPAVRVPSPYALRFSELERALNATDWSSRPVVVVIEGVDWECRYSPTASVIMLHSDFEDDCDVFGSLTLIRSSNTSPATPQAPA